MERIRGAHLKHPHGRPGGDVSYELRIQYLSLSREPNWTPAINAYRCRGQIAVCVDLAGVDREKIDLQAAPRSLLIRGVREPLEKSLDECPRQVFAIEIDQGFFQREIPLPSEIDPSAVHAEQRNGLLWIYLPLAQ